MIDTSAPHLTPLYHPYSHLAYAVRGSDVIHTVVEGRVVYRERRHTTLDLASIRTDANRLGREILAAHRS